MADQKCPLCCAHQGDADVVIIWYGGWTNNPVINTASTITTMMKCVAPLPGVRYTMSDVRYVELCA